MGVREYLASAHRGTGADQAKGAPSHTTSVIWASLYIGNYCGGWLAAEFRVPSVHHLSLPVCHGYGFVHLTGVCHIHILLVVFIWKLDAHCLGFWYASRTISVMGYFLSLP